MVTWNWTWLFMFGSMHTIMAPMHVNCWLICRVSSDVHGLASGHEPGRAELFWARPSWAPEVAHQGLRPGSGKVKAGAGSSGRGWAPVSHAFDLSIFSHVFSLPLASRPSPLAPHSSPPSRPPAQAICKQITNPPTLMRPYHFLLSFPLPLL